MANDEFNRTLSYANKTMALLKQGEVPAYPQFYELFFTYSTGVNPGLNERINSILGNGIPKLEIVESLYNEFLKSDAIDERVSAVSNLMSKSIDSVQGAIQNASDTAATYSGELELAGNAIACAKDQEALSAVTKQLQLKTKIMHDANKALEGQLNSAQDDVALLKRDLEEVQRQSMTDSLTNIYNRKFFDLHITRSITECRQKDEPLCLIMADIDHFKNFNDTFGHQTGDQVLRLVAMTLRSNTKGSDLACRYGGEEFALILPNTSLKDAISLANTIRKAVQAKELLKRSTNEKLGRVTSSFGVSLLTPTDTEITLIERADRALYAAKRNGRNRVIAEDDKIMQVSSAA
ncbi:MAG: GGDEF domain-containing protein [Devosiaceae bacterium]|nr:GGDEF domain-containing protein [Devosiaceae bacterium]